MIVHDHAVVGNLELARCPPMHPPRRWRRNLHTCTGKPYAFGILHGNQAAHEDTAELCEARSGGEGKGEELTQRDSLALDRRKAHPWHAGCASPSRQEIRQGTISTIRAESLVTRDLRSLSVDSVGGFSTVGPKNIPFSKKRSSMGVNQPSLFRPE